MGYMQLIELFIRFVIFECLKFINIEILSFILSIFNGLFNLNIIVVLGG